MERHKNKNSHKRKRDSFLNENHTKYVKHFISIHLTDLQSLRLQLSDHGCTNNAHFLACTAAAAQVRLLVWVHRLFLYHVLVQ